jgi:hypothetical protein
LLVAVDFEHKFLNQQRAGLSKLSALVFVRFRHRCVVTDAAAQRINWPQLRGRLSSPKTANGAPDTECIRLVRHLLSLSNEDNGLLLLLYRHTQALDVMLRFKSDLQYM